MRIRALSVFEGVVYHCWPIDRSNPCRPTLEVDALLRDGDADATSGPLLVTVADYIVMVGGLDTAKPCLEQLQAKGRIVDRLGAQHISFPTWTRVPTDAENATGAHEPDAEVEMVAPTASRPSGGGRPSPADGPLPGEARPDDAGPGLDPEESERVRRPAMRVVGPPPTNPASDPG